MAMSEERQAKETARALLAALKKPDIFVREATGEKYVRIGKRLVALKGLDAKGVPVIACDSEQIPNAEGGQDVVVRPRAIQCQFDSHDPGAHPGE